MNIETLIQSFKLGEKQAITQALCDLIDFLAQGPKAQEDVIQFLPEHNLLMVIDYLSDPDAYIRRLTTKFLLDLVHNNYLVQLVFCDILGLIPTDGKICLNNVPDPFKHVARYVPECLETLKQSAPEEKNEQLPYCWYLHVQNADKQDKKITFVSTSDKDSILEMDELFDPCYAVVGFIMRCPRKENTSKVLKSKLSEIVKPIVTQMSVDLTTNISMDQSLHQKTLPDQPKGNVSINGENMSVKRKPLMKNGIVGLPHISSRASSKPNMNLTMLTPTNTQLKTEKDQQNKTILVVSDHNDEPTSATSDKKIVTRVVFKKMPSEDRKIASRKTEPSIEPFELFQGSKLNASVADAQENEIKTATLENSLNNSLVIKGKSSVATPSASSASTKFKTQTQAQTTPKTVKNSKTMTHREKELSSILTTDEVSLSQHGKQKSTDLDKKGSLKTPKGTVYSMPSSSSRTVPNTTLLNKILKAKPVPAKEKTHVMSQSIHHGKHDQKGSFWDFIYAYRKINATTLSSVISTTNKSAKTSTVNTAKKQEQQQDSKSSSTTQIRKRAMHTSLIQGNIEPNSSVSNRYEALDDELSLDMTPKDSSLSSRKNTVPLKTYHVSQSFKNPSSSSRASQELKKESVTTFGKFMSPRKSSDVTYLTNHKKKVDTSAVSDVKNKKTQQKKANQTLTHEPVQVK